MEPAEKQAGALKVSSAPQTHYVSKEQKAVFSLLTVSPASPLKNRSVTRSLSVFVSLVLFLCLELSYADSSSEFYLARFGPPPLRFSAAPATNNFIWPVPLVRTNAATNSVDVLNSSDPIVSTNSTVLSAVSVASANPNTDPAALPGPFILPIPFGLSAPLQPDPNSLSASNLLNITPQMLADYFKANLETTYRFSTNSNGADVLFNPPVPAPKPVPSSEATYRVQ